MADKERGKGDLGTVKGRLELVDLGERERPAIELRLVEPDGERRPLKLGDDGAFSLDGKLVGRGLSIEVGAPESGELRRYRYDFAYEELARSKALRIPPGLWGKWFVPLQCVTGRVRVCRFLRPWEATVAEVLRTQGLKAALVDVDAGELLRPFFGLCRPVCQGKVEVFLQTCCCPPLTPADPPVVIKNICEIIDCREIVWPRKPWDPGDPVIVPHLPGGGGDPLPVRTFDAGEEDGSPDAPLGSLHAGVERAVVRAVKRAEAQEGGLPAPEILRLAGHLTTLLELSPESRVAYLERFPELCWPICHCSVTKVAEAPLQSDGHFDACFWRPFLRPGCTQRVLYRISQFQSGGWAVVYDDLALHRTHALSDDPLLTASGTAHACDDDPHQWGNRPFALLERIGSGYHANLLIHSGPQAGDDRWTGSFAATDGLVNPPPSGPPPGLTAGPFNQPWGGALALRYALHPGLAGIGAAFYRTRILRLDGTGHPVPGSEVLYDDPLSWGRYVFVGGDVHIEWVQLRQPVVNGVDGLYTIPDHASDWLDEQYHAVIDTDRAAVPNGRYVFLLELYDSSARRLVPDTAAGGPAAGDHTPALAFDFRRLDGPLDTPFTNTSVVPQRALGNLFLVDNLRAYADIEAIQQNTAPASATNCQFLVATDGSETVALQYSAYQSSGYQWYHDISIKQGLTGPETTVTTQGGNVFNGLSPAETFASLLLPETKCAFAAGLTVRVKHTNGSGRLSGYDRGDTAAFALEISP
jgi:hypothetical protein